MESCAGTFALGGLIAGMFQTDAWYCQLSASTLSLVTAVILASGSAAKIVVLTLL